MSEETLTWLNNNTLVGFTEKRGNAWHYKASEQGVESNHYVGAIPLADVIRRLFHWEAEKVPLFAAVDAQVPCELDEADGIGTDGLPYRTVSQTIVVPDTYAIYRPDTQAFFGVFKDGYQIHQYSEWLLEKVSTLLGDTINIGSAVLLKGGALACVGIETPDTLTTPSGFQYRPHLLAATSLDGSLSTTYKPVITAPICDNTLAAGLSEKSAQVKVKHSRYSHLKLTDSRSVLGILEQTADAFEAEVAELTAITVTDRQWAAFLDLTVPVPEAAGRGKTLAENKRSALEGLWNHDNRVTDWKGTAFGVLQAVNTYTHHLSNVRGGERVERNATLAVTGAFDKLDSETVDNLHLVGVGA